MDSFPGRALVFIILGLFILGMTLLAVIYAVELMAMGKKASGIRPILVYLAIFTGYGVFSAGVGHWFVEYRLASFCEHVQAEIRKLPPQASPDAIATLSGHRLIFTRPEVTVLRDDGSGITVRIEDPRGFLAPAFYVDAREIRLADEW